MAKKTTKIWAVDPSTDKKTLMASFEVDGGKVNADIKHDEIKERAKDGYHTDDGRLTLEKNGPEFVELLAANYSTSSFVLVTID
jgi:hypothetical protein